MKGPRLLAPEVVQTSGMDCGPAALKCLLEGFGIHASYGRLREACQTDVDGTSIDTVEQAAVQVGLDAQQIMVPVDHLLLARPRLLPALVVVTLPNGVVHFVVAWRRHGGVVQVMDPATGRRWTSCRRFLQEVYLHRMTVPARAWREWAGTPEFLEGLELRLARLGLSHKEVSRMLETAASDPGWRSLAALDAGARAAEDLARHGLGHDVTRTLLRAPHLRPPEPYWSVRAAGPDELLFRGAVLVQIRGRRPAPASTPLPLELAAALQEPPARPGRELLRLLRAEGVVAPGAVLAALLFAAAGVILEAVLFRVFLDLRPELGLTGQRLGALGAVLGFVFLLLMLELAVAARVFDFGRRLEVRLRAAFLEKLPRLADRYFHSRLASDMAERSHSIHQVRLLPEMGSQFLRWSFELALTAAAIGWLDRALALPAMLAAALAVGLPLAAQPLLAERDLRLRSHTGALSRFYLDALLGLVAIRTHGGEGAVRREHGGVLAEWARAGFALQRAGVAVQAAQLFAGFGLAAWMVLDHVARQAESGSVLLLLYWVLNLPVLGQEIALIAWQYPGYRNLTLRLLEPLGAPEEPPAPQAPLAQGPRTPGVALSLERVSVRAAGRTILEDIDLRVEPGGHVAIVGPSGAGKSSLVGLLLGWHPAACGRVLVDGAPLDACGLEQLRRDTAWVDAAVHLWNRSVLENLRYGLAGEEAMPLGEAIDRAGLHPVLEKLPDGLQTILGEGGALVSGGEGQRVRLARALLRPGARLVILDEPFAGLERGLRRELLARCRERWRSCTFLCITHDIAETLEFPRVVVMEAGRLVEDGVPAELARRPGSRFRALLEAEEQVRERLWGGPHWRRLRLARGRLLEEDVPSLGALWEEEEASCRRRDR